MKRSVLLKLSIIGGITALFSSFLYVAVPIFFPTSYNLFSQSPALLLKPQGFVATHLKTPPTVKAIYMTACVASTPDFRNTLTRLIDETEINSVVIDIKDYTGSISFATEEPLFSEAERKGCFAPDMREFIGVLHDKGVYVIGRVTVFQDPIMARKRPDLAIQRESDKSVWRDYKGLSFIDVSAREYWDYIITLTKVSYRAGFDEINFDYIRFPSDGNMTDIYYPWSEERILLDPQLGKAQALEDFFAYLESRLKDSGPSTGSTGSPQASSGQAPVLSADFFGMTTTNTDDLNIGQVLERALPYFDYIAPMVYPSHYPPNFIGLSNPAANPYTVVKYSLDKAFERASSTPEKIRPWLQDFDLGAIYTSEMVRAQIQATYDAGFSSWMLWDAANTYTKAALLPN